VKTEMSFFRGEIYSNQLQMQTSISVILPDDFSEDKDGKPKILFLLHGSSDNSTSWIRNTRVEMYAKRHNLIIVMPEVQKSFYTDMVYGLKYFSYVADELPQICRNLFHASEKRDDNFIAGLSMGGYGALKCALRRPETFSKVGVFSAPFNLESRFSTFSEDKLPELMGIFGNKMRPEDDLFQISKDFAESGAKILPQIFATCGTKDFLYEDNTDFWNHMTKIGLEYEYMEWEGFHEWGFWDKSVQLMIEKFLV